MNKTIFQCVAGSRLYGTNGPNSDIDYKAVHLPTKTQILLGTGKGVVSTSTGSSESQNTADDTDLETFSLQRFFKLASDMQTIPVEMLFVKPENIPFNGVWRGIWSEVRDNRDKILSRNTKSFVGYCKGQAVRYSMRGKRLETYKEVCAIILGHPEPRDKVSVLLDDLKKVAGVKVVAKPQPGDVTVDFLDVYGRQVPVGISCKDAANVYLKPVNEAGDRTKNAQQSGGMDRKALYHAVRIVDQGIALFGDGFIEFPCQNLDFLIKIRSGDFDINHILDVFDEKMAVLAAISDRETSPLADKPDLDWINDFVYEVHEDIVRGQL